MTRDEIISTYFDWLYNIVCGQRFSDQISYRKLLSRLHEIEYIWYIPLDANRANDGLNLRYRFALDKNMDHKYVSKCIEGPCSVLEMIVALAIRCEESIMDDPQKGDRTGQWFWGMIVNLGLGSMTDDKFDISYVEDHITTLLNREYEADGTGGLFTVKDSKQDLRKVEIWTQLSWYIGNIT